jgi:hypothetical protein
VSAGNAEALTVGRHHLAAIRDVARAIGVHFVMSLFILIPATAEMSGQGVAFSRPLSISSHLGRCPQEKVSGRQSNAATRRNVPAIPAAREVGCIV